METSKQNKSMRVETMADSEKPEQVASTPPCACYAPEPGSIEEVLFERQRQFAKWGEQNHDMMTWLAILHEETGELAQASLHQKFGGPEAIRVMEEAVQVAAVALQIVEYLRRKNREYFEAHNNGSRGAASAYPGSAGSESCCVCGKPVVNVHRGGEGITVLTGPPPDNIRQAHLECAKKEKLEWFGM